MAKQPKRGLLFWGHLTGVLGALVLQSCSAADAVESSEDRMARSRRGVLRVGTPGDYAPFSMRGPAGLSGVDVDLAVRFAEHIGLPLEWRSTNWSRLVRDAEEGHFDLAVGGISVTPERQRRVTFSESYFSDHKLALFRCDEAERFRSLSDINRSEIRVVSNEGGTNQAFVERHLWGASLAIVSDNRAVVGRLLSGQEDVMITDGVEARLHARCFSELCTGLAEESLAPFSVAALFPRNSDLVERFNRWLLDEDQQRWLASRFESAAATAPCPDGAGESETGSGDVNPPSVR